MVVQNDELDRKLRSSQSSVTAMSIFIALSVATMGFLLFTRKTIEFGYNATVFSSGSLIFAIVLFLISLEFFILSIYKSEYIDFFRFIGGCLYILGVTFMVIGIALGIIPFGLRSLSYFFMTITLIGYLAYYIVRHVKVGREDYSKGRMTARIVSLIFALTAYAVICTVAD